MVVCSVFNISVTDLLRYLRYKKHRYSLASKLVFWQEKFEKQILSLQEIGGAFAQWFNITAADSVDFVHRRTVRLHWLM